MDFSLNVFGSNAYTTPILYAFVPEGTRAETLNLRTPRESESVSGTLNYAVTRDQTIRLRGSIGRNSQDNQGAGGYNLADRTFSTQGHNAELYVQEAGPVGRRFFTNTRASLRWSDSSSHSALEAPTIVVNDAFTSGGAQRAGGTQTRGMVLQSDLDYVRGINSWRTGIMLEGSWYHSDDASNYLGTYTFTSLAAFDAGTPTFFSRRVGDPTIEYSNLQAGVYLQDDIRVSKTLTLSPGLRYESADARDRLQRLRAPIRRHVVAVQERQHHHSRRRRRVYDWLSTGTYAQTHPGGRLSPARLDDHQPVLSRSWRRRQHPADEPVSARVPTTCCRAASTWRSDSISGSRRASAPARPTTCRGLGGGAGPQPEHAGQRRAAGPGVSQRDRNRLGRGVADAELLRQTGLSLLAPSAAANQASFNWKRLSVNGYYSFNHSRNNSDGPFSVPASGTLDTEWGPSLGSRRHQINFSLNSSQIKNVNFGVSLNTFNGSAYNITTGLDNNGDLFFNDRPVGVSRNSARTPDWSETLSLRLSYNLTFGKGAASAPQGIMITSAGVGGITVASAPAAANRYRMSINITANNVTNRSNYSGYSGVIGSPGFGIATSSGEPRRIMLSTSFGF